MPEWKVPGYTELKALGSGGFGDVMLARHDPTGTLVAIKYLHRDLLADAEFTQLFRAEATVLASVDDPNVVRLYEYVETQVGAAIVMELIGGATLREILTFQGKTTAEAALVVLQGSLLGLAAAHRRGVVHRDFKPENVLVNGDGISKLTDFGIAARAGDLPVPAGTLLYAAPEQMAGALASPASDVYAATATFYECLTGQAALPGGGRRPDPPAPVRAGADGARARIAAAAGRRRNGEGSPWPAGRRDHLRHRAQRGRVWRLRPGLAAAGPVAPGRGRAPARRPVALRPTARGPGHRRTPGSPGQEVRTAPDHTAAVHAAAGHQAAASRRGQDGGHSRRRHLRRGSGHRAGLDGGEPAEPSAAPGRGSAAGDAPAVAHPDHAAVLVVLIAASQPDLIAPGGAYDIAPAGDQHDRARTGTHDYAGSAGIEYDIAAVGDQHDRAAIAMYARDRHGGGVRGHRHPDGADKRQLPRRREHRVWS